MKINTLKLSVFFVLLVNTCVAQTAPSVLWGDFIPLPAKFLRIDMVGNTETGFVQVAGKNRHELYFITYDGQLKKRQTKQEALPGSNTEIENLVLIHNRAYTLFSAYDKGTDKETLYVQELDLQNGGWQSEPKQINIASRKIFRSRWPFTFYDYTIPDKYNVSVSEEHIMITYAVNPLANKSDHESVGYIVLDTDWNILWSKEFQMPYTKGNFKIVSSQLVDDRVLVTGLYQSEKINATSLKQEFDRIVVFEIKNGSNINEYHSQLEGFVPHNISTSLNGSQLLIAGHKDANTNNQLPLKTNGIFSVIFDTEELTFGLLSTTNFKGEGIDNIIPELQLHGIFPRSNGGWYLVGEKYEQYLGKEGTFIYLDAIVGILDEDGHVERYSIAPKRQYFQNTSEGAGMASFVYDDNLYMIHLDHLKNKDWNGSTPLNQYRRGMPDALVVCQKVSADGSVQRISLYGIGEPGKTIYPDGGIQEIKPGLLLSVGTKNGFRRAYNNATSLIRLQ